MPLLSEIVDEFMADLSTPRTRHDQMRAGGFLSDPTTTHESEGDR